MTGRSSNAGASRRRSSPRQPAHCHLRPKTLSLLPLFIFSLKSVCAFTPRNSRAAAASAAAAAQHKIRPAPWSTLTSWSQSRSPSWCPSPSPSRPRPLHVLPIEVDPSPSRYTPPSSSTLRPGGGGQYVEDQEYYSSNVPVAGSGGGGGGLGAAPGGVGQRVTLTRFLNDKVQDRPELRDMESILLSFSMSCKTISTLVNRPNQLSLPPSSTTDGALQYDYRLNSMKRLDQLSTNVLRNALRFTGKLQMVTPARSATPEAAGDDDGPAEHQPGVLIASAIDGRYVACFDPLDGSGNADAGICTGTVFGLFETPEEDDEDERGEGADGGVDNVALGGGGSPGAAEASPSSPPDPEGLVRSVLQPGKNLRAAGYCLYSSATILVFTLGEGTHGFTLDPQINEFVLTHPNIRIPPRGNVYSCNEANSEGWDDDLKAYLSALKSGKNDTKQKYALRYVGSMVGDIHRTLMYGGIFCYPSDSGDHPRGNLQLLYKSAPMGYVVAQAGGSATDGKRDLLDVRPRRVHERSPCFIGSPDDINEMKKYIKHEE